MHNQILGRTAEQAFFEPVRRCAANNNLRTAILDRDGIQRLGHVAMAHDALCRESRLGQCLDRGRHDPLGCKFDLFLAPLVP